MSNNIPQKPYKLLTPFGIFVKHNFPFIEATYEARDNYDLLCKVVEHLKTVEYNQGIAQENIEALYNFLNTLDLQDEVNNKLDEMAEDGTLQEIISEYLNSQAVFGFDNVEAMKSGENLINGSYAYTMGYYQKNDGGNGVYYITNEINNNIIQETLNNGLYANLIVNNNTILANTVGMKPNDNTFDNDTIFQKVINLDICKSIEFQNGNYYFEKITLKNGKNIKGQGPLNTSLIAKVSSESAFISLDYGPVAYLKFQDLKLIGNENNLNQTGLYLNGLPAQQGLAHGGEWYTIFENLHISGFTNNQIHLRGVDPTSSFLIVNQFLTFNNVYAFGNTNSKDVCLIESQNGQLLFNNCEFDNAPENYYNLKMNGADCEFNKLTIQHADNGIYSSGSNILFNHIWIEQIHKNIVTFNDAITTYGSCCNFIGGTFRNSATSNTSKGFILTSRTLLKLDSVKFMEAGTNILFDVSHDYDICCVEETNCYHSTPPTTYMTNNFYLTSASNGTLSIGTSRILRISNVGGAISDLSFNSFVKYIKEINCWAHNNIEFTGSKFVNPQTISTGTFFKIVRIGIETGTSEKYLILV